MTYRAQENIMAVIMYLLFGLLILIIIVPLSYKFIADEPLMKLSEGTMISKGTKLSYKGYIWKTWDGWIPIGLNSEGGLRRWKFTVKDGNKEIIKCLESGNQVKLYYDDFVLIPIKMGNSHQVNKCESIESIERNDKI